MIGFLTFFHAFISLLLLVIILMQSGRGGGLTEAFASAESMFGANTNELLIKGTTDLASLFLVTSLSLAVLSAQRGKSIMTDRIAEKVQKEVNTSKENRAVSQAVKDTANKTEQTVNDAAKAVSGSGQAAEVPSGATAPLAK